MKIYQKLGMTLFGVLALTACGSSSVPATTIPAAQQCVVTNVNTCVNGVYTPVNGGNGFGGVGTYPITNSMGISGTETVTQVFNTLTAYNYYQSTITGSTFSETASVSAGDEVIVSLAGSIEQTNGSWGPFQTYSSNYLTDFQVNVGTQILGTSVSARYLVQAAGTLTFSSGTSTSGTTYVGIPLNDNVYIAHCVSTAGAVMSCQ